MCVRVIVPTIVTTILLLHLDVLVNRLLVFLCITLAKLALALTLAGHGDGWKLYHFAILLPCVSYLRITCTEFVSILLILENTGIHVFSVGVKAVID